MANTIVWIDLPCNNLDRAARFYSAVLAHALRVEEEDGKRMMVLPHEGNEVAGCLFEGEDYTPSRDGILVYFNVEGRLEQAVQAARDQGGEVLQDIHSIGPYGRRAVVVDSEGNRIALHAG